MTKLNALLKGDSYCFIIRNHVSELVYLFISNVKRCHKHRINCIS